MWDLPGPGIESVFPELASGFYTTATPEKSSHYHFCVVQLLSHVLLFATPWTA